MNATATTISNRVAIFRRPNLPIICPHCSNSLGVIDENEIAARYAWAQAVTEQKLRGAYAPPGVATEASLIRGECPHCGSELAAISVIFRRADGGADEAPRLSIALHGASYTGWAMIETDAGGVSSIEHLFEPRPAHRAQGAVEFLEMFLLADLPRPEPVAAAAAATGAAVAIVPAASTTPTAAIADHDRAR